MSENTPTIRRGTRRKGSIDTVMKVLGITFLSFCIIMLLLLLSSSEEAESNPKEVSDECPNVQSFVVRHNEVNYPTLILSDKCWSNPRLLLTTPTRKGYRDHYRFSSDPPGAIVEILKNDRELIGPISIDSLQTMRQVHSLRFKKTSPDVEARIFVSMERYKIGE